MTPAEDIRVTASDALEFEPVETKRPSRSRGIWLVLGLVVLGGGGAAAWWQLGDKLTGLFAGAEAAVPLIRAAEGPIKIKPENPGGMNVPNRDKLVYGRLQGEQLEPGVERLLPRPEQPKAVPQDPAPREVARIDAVPAAELVESIQKPDPIKVSPPLPPESATGGAAAGEAASSETAQAASAAPTKLVPGAEPPSPPRAPGAAGGSSATASTTPTKPAPTPSAPRQAPRQASVTPPPPPTAAPNRTPTPAAAPVVRSAPATAYRVQLAAARTPEAARSEWDRLRRKHLDLLGNLGLTVTKADLGAARGVFYRLRVGPLGGEPQARDLCSRLKARKVGCLIIKPGR